MSDRAVDDLEEALLGVSALIESTVAINRDRYSTDRLITTIAGPYRKVLDTAQEMITGARSTIDILHARRVQEEERTERSERQLLYRADPSVSIRLLCSPELLDEGFVREQLGREHPVAIRVARVPPLQAIMVDRARALVVTGPAINRRASVIRVPEVIHTLHILFDNVWRGAVPAGERIVFGDRARAAFARQILGALRAGVTDEVAARDLTVSVRTYRRYVAEIMTLLGANSRFQAGVRAAELGLLPSDGRDGRAPGRPGPE
ncbi:TrmB family transcriptional regulator sugar-binding domain-containing protein [Kitasatospora aureofaciens]|uniref:TrmB family transcriptional regulator sugar-binding domain-containing protein n=1 Tax=Kitasatospora aureofaciens TaxID=1894 RepID=UPI0027E0C7BE|nr:TrmB family transcriptional regulator sugar-binding domain-containing protein [Kitasatospora aureofaciens]